MKTDTNHNWGGKRDGAGRPQKFAEYARITISLDAADLERLDKYCERRGEKRSEVIQRLIRRLR